MKKTVCLNPKCKLESYVRGLCRPCYSAARQLIKQGEVTWRILIKEGKALEPGPTCGDKGTRQWLRERPQPLCIDEGEYGGDGR